MTDQILRRLQSFQLAHPLKLSLLWAALMFLYVYNDYIIMYVPGYVEMMSAGRMGPLGQATDAILLGVAVLMAIPSLMVFLSASLPAAPSKWLNVLFGVAYTCVNAATFIGSKPFYQFVVALEVLLTLTIIVTALRWPKTPADAQQ